MLPAQLGSWFKVENMVVPKEGPRCIRADMDFSTEGSYSIEGLLATTTGTISYIQGMYVNNYDNDDTLTIVCQVTQQYIKVPPNSQGYYAVMNPNDPRFIVSTTPVANLTCQIHFYNMPMQPAVWYGENGTPVSGDWLTDAELRAAPVDVDTGLLQGLTDAQLRAAAVPVTSSQPIGGAYTNRSIANLSGVSEPLMAANANRRTLGLSNEGATPIAINMLGGAAALNTAGSVTILAGGSIILDNYPPVGAITIIGTLNADITAWEG